MADDNPNDSSGSNESEQGHVKNVKGGQSQQSGEVSGNANSTASSGTSETDKEQEDQDDKETDEQSQSDELPGEDDSKDEPDSCTSETSTTTDSEDDSDFRELERELALLNPLEGHLALGKTLTSTKVVTVTDLNRESNNCASPGSTSDIFEECNPFDDSDAKTVLDNQSIESSKTAGEQKLPLPVSTPTKPPKSQEEVSKAVAHYDCFGKPMVEKEPPTRFCKNVPLDPSQTWDFSLQGLNKDFKSKVLWIEGSFYQKFIGNCLHEMHNVPCECEEKKKISVCRLCHRVFCSNKCFKKALKAQTGEDGDDEEEEETEEPELLPEEAKVEPVTETRNLGNMPKPKSDIKKEPSENKALPSKLGNKFGDQPEKLVSTDKNKRYQNLKTSEEQGRAPHRQPRNQQYGHGANSFPGAQQFSGPPPPNMWPTQVHIGNTYANATKTSSTNVPMKSPLPPMGSSSNTARGSKPQEFSEPGNCGTANLRNNRSNDGMTKTNDLTAYGGPQNVAEPEGDRYVGDGFRQSPTKDPPVRIPRNPHPYTMFADNEEPKNFFTQRGRGNIKHSPNSTSPKFPKSQGEEEHSSPEQNRQPRHNSGSAALPATSPNSRNPNETYQRLQSNLESLISPMQTNNLNTNLNGDDGIQNKNACDLERRNSQAEDGAGAGQFPPRNISIDGISDVRNQSRKDFAQPFKNQNKGMTKRDKFGKHPSAEGYQLHNNVGDYQPSRNNQANFLHNLPSRNDHYKKGYKNADRVQPLKDFSGPSNSRPGPSRNEGPDLMPSTSSTFPFQHSYKNNPSTASTYLNKNKGQNKEYFRVLDNIDVPNGVSMPVKYTGGKDFYDFSVMTLRSWDVFKKLHSSMQDGNKVKMDICEYGSYCAIKYRPADSENSSEEWYRGIIIKDVVSQIGVYLIDVGIHTVIDRELVHDLPPQYLSHPPLAIRVTSLNVKVQVDDPEVSEQFNTLVRENRAVKIKITHKDKKEPCRFGCFLDVQHLNKWFDAGVLLKKLQVGDQATLVDIECEETQHLIVPFKRYPVHQDLLQVSGKNSIETLVQITHVVSPNEFYVITQKSHSKKSQVDSDLQHRSVELKPIRCLKDLSYPLYLWVDNQHRRSRVKVLEVADLSTGVEVLVQQVDTGEIYTVPMKELNKIPQSLQKTTPCAYKCSLPVKPVSKARSKSVSLFEEATKILNEMKGKPFCIKVFFLEQSTHTVDLYLPSAKDGCTATFIQQGWVELALDLDLTIKVSRN